MFKDFANMDAPTIHEVSYNVVEVFEDYLESLNVVIPCADADEESERLEDDNAAALYGEEYRYHLSLPFTFHPKGRTLSECLSFFFLDKGKIAT